MNGLMMPCAVICWIWREINMFTRYYTISLFSLSKLCLLTWINTNILFYRFLAGMVVHPREKRFCWKIMILYGLNFDMHILLMYVLSFLFSIYCLGFWIYYVESCLLVISYATWIPNDFDGLARLVNGCMRRWPTSFQRIKLHKSSMVRGES